MDGAHKTSFNVKLLVGVERVIEPVGLWVLIRSQLVS